MGETKRTKKTVRAQKLKEQKKNVAFAILRNNPTSPRKMRLVAGLIRNQPANKALDILQFSPQEAAIKLRKLLQSAIANWVSKNENARLEDAYRIRKRSNHVTIILGTKENKEEINGTEN